MGTIDPFLQNPRLKQLYRNWKSMWGIIKKLYLTENGCQGNFKYNLLRNHMFGGIFTW